MPKKAFSLIELLIYVSIFAVVAGLMTSILVTILKVSQKESASIETSEQLSFVMQTVSRLIRESSNIEIASSGSSPSFPALKLRMKDKLKDPTCLYLENNVIKLAEGPYDEYNKQNCVSTASASNLTSDKVIADKLKFSKITNYPGHDVVSIDIQLIYNSNNPQSQITRNLKSAIARVSAATFDDNLIPGSDDKYDLGFSPNTRWKDANFSGDLLVGGKVGIGTTNPGGKFHISGAQDESASGFGVTGVVQRLSATNNGVEAGWFAGVSGGLNRATFGTMSAHDLGFVVGGSTRMTIVGQGANVGNVGIGITDPTYKLDVQSNDGGIIGQFKSFQSGSGNPYIRFGTNNNMGDIRFGNDSAQAALINTTGGWQWNTQLNIMNGNVGIGTTTPSAKLQVVGGDNSFAWSGDHSDSGYIRMGNMQICWGNDIATGLGGDPYYIAYKSVTFPSGCVFNNGTYSTSVNLRAASSNGKAFTPFQTFNISTNAVDIYFHKISDASQEEKTATGNLPFTWMAIGTWQ